MDEEYSSKSIYTDINSHRVIAITSGKGGVGKTSLVINMAIAFRSFGKKVVVLDGDLALSNIDILLGLAPQYNLKHVLLGHARLKEIIIEGPNGIKIIPASSGTTELTNLDSVLKMKLISELDEYEEDIDILVIDTAAGISQNVQFFCSSAQDVIIVITPEAASIYNANALIKELARNYSERHFKIIINSAQSTKQAINTFKQVSMTSELCFVSLQYLGYIPTEELIKQSIESNRAFVELFPHIDASRRVYKLCEKLLESEDEYIKGNMQFFLRKRLTNQMNSHSKIN